MGPSCSRVSSPLHVHDHGGEIAVAHKDDMQGPHEMFLPQLCRPQAKGPQSRNPSVQFSSRPITHEAAARARTAAPFMSDGSSTSPTARTTHCHALRVNDMGVANPELLKLLRERFSITLMLGTQPLHDTFTSLTTLQAKQLEKIFSATHHQPHVQ